MRGLLRSCETARRRDVFRLSLWRSGLEVGVLHEKTLPLDGEGDEPGDRVEHRPARLGLEHDEDAARLPADEEREVDVACPAGRRHLRDLAPVEDDLDEAFVLGSQVASGPRDDRRPIAPLGVLEKPAASCADGTEGPRGGLAEDADAIRGGEEVDREVVENLDLPAPPQGVGGLLARLEDEPAHDDRDDEEAEERDPVRGLGDREGVKGRQEEEVEGERRGEGADHRGAQPSREGDAEDDHEEDQADGRRVQFDEPDEGRGSSHGEERDSEVREGCREPSGRLSRVLGTGSHAASPAAILRLVSFARFPLLLCHDAVRPCPTPSTSPPA